MRRKGFPFVSVSPTLTFFTVCGCAKLLNRVRLFVTPWTVAHQAPLSLGSSGTNTGVGFHALLQGNLPDPGIELASLYCLLH